MKKMFYGINRVKVLNEVTRSVNAYLNDPSAKKIIEVDETIKQLHVLISSAISKGSIKENLIEEDMLYPPKDPVLDRDIRTYDLPFRVVNGLTRCGLRTIRDVVQYRKKDLLKLRNMGKSSIKALSDCIEEQGVEWE